MRPDLPANAFDQLVADLTPRYGAGEARSIARIAFEDAFGTRQPAEKVFSAGEETRFLTIRQRLLAGEPVQYVLGQADFFGLKFNVTPAVLIPRQETEELADRAVKFLKKNPGARALDIGTGSGCIAAVLALKCPASEVWATDVSPEALALAGENARRLGAPVTFRRHDILPAESWDELPGFDLVVSNPPYIPRREAALMPGHVLRHEPHLALFVEDDDPLLFYRAIADFSKKKLPPGGALLLECNEFNAAQVADLLREKGLSGVQMHQDLSGADRIVGAYR